jgi:two-component system CheB/CheR fusion protein
VARVLALWNHDVQICHDGFAALELARTFKPEVVLSDISLPRMDGYRLAHELRLLPGLEQVRLIAISGYGQAEDQRRSMEAGFEQHLLKPVAPEALAGILSEATPTVEPSAR